MKWGMTANYFSKVYLETGMEWNDHQANAKEDKISNIINKLKRMLGAI
jgi:hypothetical protein